MNREEVGRRFARLVTNAVVRSPWLWRLFRRGIRLQFDSLAPRWDAMLSEEHLAPFERALKAVEPAPRRALDVGTGTGAGAFAIARRFPRADVVGVDVAQRMLAQARSKTPLDIRSRVRFESGDASALPYEEDSFDLVSHANMIPFFNEVARVVAPGGMALFSFSGGPSTPIYVPPERLRAELERRGFTEFANFEAGNGNAFLARKGDHD